MNNQHQPRDPIDTVILALAFATFHMGLNGVLFKANTMFMAWLVAY